MQKTARFFYKKDEQRGKECYVLKTFDSNGHDEGIVAVYYFTDDGNNISYTALCMAIELQNLGYKLEICNQLCNMPF